MTSKGNTLKQNNTKHINDMKTRLMMSLLLPTALVLLPACGGRQKETVSEVTDTAAVDIDTVPGTAAMPVLEGDTLGCVHVGMLLDSIPAECPPLYERYTRGNAGDYEEYVFSSEGEEMFAALDFGSGRIDVISLLSPRIEARTHGGRVHLGTPFAAIVAQPATRAEWAGYDAVGRWSWTNAGLWFMPDESALDSRGDRKLLHKLYDSMQAPDSEEFGARVTIGYIGTGLPF